MKLQDVILKAMAKKISWMGGAKVAGVTDRTMRRIRERYQKFGYTGLLDQKRGKRSTHRIPMEKAEQVPRLYREKYFDLNIRHFHEKLREEHRIELSYTWVQQALQGARLVAMSRRSSSDSGAMAQSSITTGRYGKPTAAVHGAGCRRFRRFSRVSLVHASRKLTRRLIRYDEGVFEVGGTLVPLRLA